MTTASRVTPARLSFLAIYNPTLGPTDETFADQLVFWYSRAANKTKEKFRKRGAKVKEKGDGVREGEVREEENERLRQIGLAQGMVHFARTFSDGEPVDSVETEKARIVLKELEAGWWMLASIDLTRLPSMNDTGLQASSKRGNAEEKKGAVEYSSREVSPPALLIQQLIQAHHIFSLHHGSSLNDLFVRLSRDRFCSALGRYWSRFARSWDVLLHGNPVVEVLGGLKLASGGELGFGVGEEEWGSGEREVLEDLVNRTDGLVDLVVARYGEPATKKAKNNASYTHTEALPWLGSGAAPSAADGVFFSGVNAISRPSLRNISHWMQDVYTQGEFAYGVHDSPSRERRVRRRGPPHNNVTPHADSSPKPCGTKREPLQTHVSGAPTPSINQEQITKQDRSLKDERNASQDRTTASAAASVKRPPGIPPPIVSAAEQALQKATAGAQNRPAPDTPEPEDSGTTLGIPDQYMKYMTFGLSSLAKSYTAPRPPERRRRSNASETTLKQVGSEGTMRVSAKDNDESALSQIEPIPDGEALKAKLAYQVLQENKGYFLIGWIGDLEVQEAVEEAEQSEGTFDEDTRGSRTLLRTLHVELAATQFEEEPKDASPDRERGRTRLARQLSSSQGSYLRSSKRLRVLLYVHRPFMYCFLFDQRAESLSYTEFYRTLHRNLQPIHKALLTSTNEKNVRQRIESSQVVVSEIASTSSNRHPAKAAETAPIYDLLYDPARLTVHTSIPDIPAPGTSAAEGLASGSSKSTWTRLDALNVHSQILTTLASTTSQKCELERTSRTTRGWWIVWMRLPPSSRVDSEAEDKSTLHQPGEESTMPEEGNHRIAFLVRRANDAPAGSVNASAGSRVASGMWSSLALRSGPSLAEKPIESGMLAGGIGVDARKYVEGLLSLNR